MTIKEKRNNIKEKLEKMGAGVATDDLHHRLIVNNKYCYCYLNGNFFNVNGHLGEGLEDFLEFIQNNMSK